LKGREIAAEIEEAARTWQMAFELKPSVTDKDGQVLLLKALKRKV
jgi:16S rRNA (guanine527-N7)-methyltransferase